MNNNTMTTMNTKTLLALAFAGLFAATAISAPVGVTVNGIALDDAGSSGDGWTYVSPTLTLSGPGPFTLSGGNTAGKVQVVVPAGVTNAVTLSNLTLKMPWSMNNVCAFALETDARVSLFLAGESIFESASNRAGVEVPAGALLSITNAPDDSAGTLLAYGGYQAAGIGSGYEGAAGTVTVNGGIVVAQGGYYSAGIGAGYYGAAGSLTVNGGEVIATGDFGGAGIGSGRGGTSGIVTITGGAVTAEGGGYAAGIGGGGSYDVNGGAGGTVTISGGQVRAYGSAYAAGIGGGGSGSSGGAGGAVTISGGTVFAQGNSGGADIGPGRNGASSGSNVFTGGSIRLAGSSVSPAPTNGPDPVACAVVTGFEPDAPVVINGLPGYGKDDIVADADGCIYLWLPNGTYTFTANERDCEVKIQNGVGPTGVTVNGEEVAFGPANPNTAEWSFDGATRTLTLAGAGPFTLAGVNVVGGVCVIVPNGVANTVTLSNLTLRTTGNGQCSFALETGANVSLSLAGTNTLASGPNRAGLEVTAGRTLSITNASGDDAGALFAYGGNGGAGIGGGYKESCGTVTLAGGTVTATSLTAGDYGGAGVGGGGGSSSSNAGAGGDITITGGSLMATGGNNATGIGGGAYGAGGSLAVSGGTVTATGEGYGAGVGGGQNRSGGAVTVTGGSLTAMGGDYGAGIGGGYYGADTDGVVVISNGTVTATGGSSGGAGIGGGYYGAGGTVRIVDGQVTAVGGASYGAGIGGGYRGAGGAVEIEGGRVVAIGGSSGAGIGGGGTSSWGVSGAGGTAKISGGTVFAQGASGSSDIGPGRDSTASGTNTFTGGSIRLAGSSIAPVPSNGTVLVACAVVSGFEPHAPVTITAGLAGYGVNDIFADADGCIYLWLPDDTYTFTANGRSCTVRIQNGVGSTGVTVNGEEVAFGPAEPNTAGWSFDPEAHTLSLFGTGPFTLSGTNAVGGVCVVVSEPTVNAVVLSNLTLRAAGSGQCVFALEENVDVALVLAGSNTLASGRLRAGLEVGAGRTLSITNAPGDEAGALTATGGYAGAGIGGGNKGAGGTVTISGGVVTGIGGEEFAAGIGGGGNGGGCALTISGGTVTAIGGRLGAGIGTGGYAALHTGGNAGTVTISGGTVTATGGRYDAGAGAGIGGGEGDAGGTVTISGGRVTATGGDSSAGIGGGPGWDDIGGAGADLTISGGTVFATGGAGGGPGIGGGVSYVENGGTTPNVSGTSLFTGGSIRIDGGYAAAAPSNGTARVWCVTVPDLEPDTAVVVASLGSYGVNDLFADEAGALYLWLPDGPYAFTANSISYTATVNGAATTATTGSPGGPETPAFATDGSAFVFDGATLAIKIVNAQIGVWYTLYEADTPSGPWTVARNVCAEANGDLVFTNLDATAPRRFFKVAASADEPQP